MKIVDVKKNIFREYDIRGKYKKDIDEDVSYTIGRSYGSYLRERGQDTCVVGRDNRYSGESLKNSLVKGILESGVNVIDIGLVTTPLYYFACIVLDVNKGIMVTASHNPKDDNGFKISFGNNQNAKGQEIKDFYEYTMKKEFVVGDGILAYQELDDNYYRYLLRDINVDKNLKVVIDCGNATPSFYAPTLYSMLGVDLITMYGKSDPSFPNHHPDPSVKENMLALSNMVKAVKADIGIAFDGDGDRVGFVDDKGRILDSDQFMAIVVKHLAKHNKNCKFLYDVKCGNTLIDAIKETESTGIMVRTGNSYTKSLTKENNCIFGGEYSGHVYFRDKFMGFDSGLYAGLRMLEILTLEKEKLSTLVDSLNKYSSSDEIKIETSDTLKFEIIEKIKEEIKEQGIEYKDIDGVRIEFDDGWGLVRASNTGNHLTIRSEGKDIDTMNKILNLINELVDKYNKI